MVRRDHERFSDRLHREVFLHCPGLQTRRDFAATPKAVRSEQNQPEVLLYQVIAVFADELRKNEIRPSPLKVFDEKGLRRETA